MTLFSVPSEVVWVSDPTTYAFIRRETEWSSRKPGVAPSRVKYPLLIGHAPPRRRDATDVWWRDVFYLRPGDHPDPAYVPAEAVEVDLRADTFVPAGTLGERRVLLRHLVSATEIAERLGVARPQVIHDWRRRHDDFPKPVVMIGGALLWIWPEVERWARATDRLSPFSRTL